MPRKLPSLIRSFVFLLFPETDSGVSLLRRSGHRFLSKAILSFSIFTIRDVAA